MKYPIVVIRKDDQEKFLHLGRGQYITLWG